MRHDLLARKKVNAVADTLNVILSTAKDLKPHDALKSQILHFALNDILATFTNIQYRSISRRYRGLMTTTTVFLTFPERHWTQVVTAHYSLSQRALCIAHQSFHGI